MGILRTPSWEKASAEGCRPSRTGRVPGALLAIAQPRAFPWPLAATVAAGPELGALKASGQKTGLEAWGPGPRGAGERARAAAEPLPSARGTAYLLGYHLGPTPPRRTEPGESPGIPGGRRARGTPLVVPEGVVPCPPSLWPQPAIALLSLALRTRGSGIDHPGLPGQGPYSGSLLTPELQEGSLSACCVPSPQAMPLTLPTAGLTCWRPHGGRWEVPRRGHRQARVRPGARRPGPASPPDPGLPQERPQLGLPSPQLVPWTGRLPYKKLAGWGCSNQGLRGSLQNDVHSVSQNDVHSVYRESWTRGSESRV